MRKTGFENGLFFGKFGFGYGKDKKQLAKREAMTKIIFHGNPDEVAKRHMMTNMYLKMYPASAYSYWKMIWKMTYNHCNSVFFFVLPPTFA